MTWSVVQGSCEQTPRRLMENKSGQDIHNYDEDDNDDDNKASCNPKIHLVSIQRFININLLECYWFPLVLCRFWFYWATVGVCLDSFSNIDYTSTQRLWNNLKIYFTLVYISYLFQMTVTRWMTRNNFSSQSFCCNPHVFFVLIQNNIIVARLLNEFLFSKHFQPFERIHLITTMNVRAALLCSCTSQIVDLEISSKR